MNNSPNTSRGPQIEGHWNGLNAFGRFQLVFDYRDLFLSLGLITLRELRKVAATSEGNREYIVDRDGHRMFNEIDLTKDLSSQSSRDKLHIALDAVLGDLGIGHC